MSVVSFCIRCFCPYNWSRLGSGVEGLKIGDIKKGGSYSIPPLRTPIRFQINKEDGSLNQNVLVDVEAANIDRIFTNSTKLVSRAARAIIGPAPDFG